MAAITSDFDDEDISLSKLQKILHSNEKKNYDDEENISLSKLKEKLRNEECCTENNDINLSNSEDETTEDDIPLQELAHTFRSKINKQWKNKNSENRQNQNNANQSTETPFHEVDHIDYFKTTGECDGSLFENTQCEIVENEGFSVTELCFDRVVNIEKENDDLMEDDGLFDLADTHIIENNTISNEDVNILYPLFDDATVYDGSESFDLIPESLENEIQNPLDSNKAETEPEADAETELDINENTEEEKEFRSRRRQKNPELWKQNTRKRKRNAGEEYISCCGQKIPRRSSQRIDCKCRFKCTEKINEDDQQRVFQNYWKSDYGGQRDFILKHVEKIAKARKTTSKKSRREHSYQYFLENEAGKKRVCKAFFLNTLNVGEKKLFPIP